MVWAAGSSDRIAEAHNHQLADTPHIFPKLPPCGIKILIQQQTHYQQKDRQLIQADDCPSVRAEGGYPQQQNADHVKGASFFQGNLQF